NFARRESSSPAPFNAGRRSTRFTNAPVGLLFYGDEGVPKAYSQGSAFGLAPRLGLVFDPKGDGKQTIRLAGAILRDTAEVFYNERLTTNAPWGNQLDIPNPAGGFTNPYMNYPRGNTFPNQV